MGFFEGFLRGGEKEDAPEMEMEENEEEIVPNPIPLLSSIANTVLHRCSRILQLSMDQLQQGFEAELPDHIEGSSAYARNLVEYCSYKALSVETKHPDHLADKEFRRLTYDMMLAWEAPDEESELLQETACNHAGVEDDDGGSIFYASPMRMAIQIDGRKTVGLHAFAGIATACPAIADPITVHNLFDALTSSCGGRLHVLIYNKYLKRLEKVLKSAKAISGPPHNSNIQLHDGEIILDADGVVATKPILQHIGTSVRPGRLTLTNHAVYFEQFGVGSHDKVVKYDLAMDLKQVVKRDLIGPWGARLFDKAVMYKSSTIMEPVFWEFPQFKGHSRRDYWFAIIREVLHVHKFIRKYNLRMLQRAEALSEAILGIFRYRAVKEAFHIIPSHFKTILAFNLAEKLPKGDKILEALNKHLELLHARFQSHGVVETSSDEKPQFGPLPVSLYTLTRMGFLLLQKEDSPEEKELLVDDIHVGEISRLHMAVQESVCYSGRAEAARATLVQVKMEDVDTNLAVIKNCDYGIQGSKEAMKTLSPNILKEFAFPLIELSKRLWVLAEWEDPFESTVFLFLILYVVYRGWVRYIFPCIFLSLAVFMLWYKHHSQGKPKLTFQITPPPSKSTVKQLVTLQEVISILETNVQVGTIVLLKLRAILLAARPQTTDKVAVILIILASAFALLPFKYLVFLVLLEMYTRQMPLRKKSSEKLVRRVREWWIRIPAAPVQIVKPHEHNK